ncbi:MAG: DUF2974 domain-containing protein [Lachnospiraceae bacterium]|nr:DUF2974 domain-containing protein [Lachnospiraceae bacterium]
MKTIIDYIKTYGHNSIEELPFSEVDSLILCQLSYLKFDGLLPALSDNRAGMTLPELKKHALFEKLFEDKRYAKMNRALFDAAAKSRRFSIMRLNNHIDMVDANWELQFSALTFTFENGLLYLAYRGTDETLTGWKEDCNMALFTPIPAQEKALQYLNGIAKCTSGAFFTGGHSKGGNLAVYAASKCHADIQERILTIYNHDGPGFPQHTLTETDGFLRIVNKIRKFMPHSSIVGMLMENHEPYEIVECKKFGILQHDPYNWIVEGTSFKRVDDVYNHVAIKDASINEWINGMSDEEKHVFVDSLFNVLTASGAETLLDFMKDWGLHSKAMIEAIEATDPKTRELLQNIFTDLFDILQHTIRKNHNIL